MDSRYIFTLKRPCANRGIAMVDNGDGSVTLDGKRFETMMGAEDYIESMPRKS